VPGICSPRILSEPRPAAVNPGTSGDATRWPAAVQTAAVRIVVALGGNALLRRGETVDLERQRARIADA
jgi:hypothetical protein